MTKKKKRKQPNKPVRKNFWWLVSGIVLALFIVAFVWEQASKPQFPLYEGKSPNRLGVVTLTVSDLSSMASFYEEVVGLTRLNVENKTVSFTADGKTPLLILEENSDAKEKISPSAGLFHFALLLPDRVSLGQYLVHLSENGVLNGASNHQYSEALYLYDPEGNGIEIYADKNPSSWQTNRDGTYRGGTFPIDSSGLLKEAANKPWEGLPASTKMGHMHLQVSNLEESEHFYVELLGFDIVAKDATHLFVSKNRYHHDIGMNIWAGSGIPRSTEGSKGLAYYTIFLPENDWLRAKEKLQQANYSFDEQDDVLKISDPSNIHLRIEKIK